MKTINCYAGGRPTDTEEARLLILLDELREDFELLTAKNRALREQHEKLLALRKYETWKNQRKAMEGK